MHRLRCAKLSLALVDAVPNRFAITALNRKDVLVPSDSETLWHEERAGRATFSFEVVVAPFGSEVPDFFTRSRFLEPVPEILSPVTLEAQLFD